MKKYLIGLTIMGLIACASLMQHSAPLTLTLYAQTLPITKTLAWDPNAASENVTNYTVTLDGTVVGTPAVTSQVITFTAVGAHTIQLTATNQWDTSGPATLTVTVVVPTKPANLRLQ